MRQFKVGDIVQQKTRWDKTIVYYIVLKIHSVEKFKWYDVLTLNDGVIREGYSLNEAELLTTNRGKDANK